VPKQVDHAQRRRHIGEAVLRLIATRGLEAASLRNVAAEAGVSMGTVQHYFTSKQEMLDFAQRYNYERATVRIPQLIAALPEPHSIRTQLRALPYHHRPAFSEHAVEP
jgi:AcrR family transcriptional regulator